MPKPTSKKTSVKKPRLIKKKTTAIDNPVTPEKKYIVIEATPEEQTKSKTLWLIVTIIAVAIIGLWFATLKKQLSKIPGNQTAALKEFGNDLTDRLNQISNKIKEIKNVSTTEADLSAARDEVITKLQQNLDQKSWPEHQSDLLKISIRYPLGWQKNETSEGLNISDGKTENNDTIFIRRVSDQKNIALANWLSASTTDSYQPPTNLIIAGQPALKYENKNAVQDIDWKIILKNKNYFYELNVNAPNRANLYEPLINEIISSLQFIQ